MSSGTGDGTRLPPGYPIRKPSDHSQVIDYPRLIADSCVLHRFLVPRHPPCALKNLTHTETKMLASTVQFSRHHPARPPPPRTTRKTKHEREKTSQRNPATRPSPQNPTTHHDTAPRTQHTAIHDQPPQASQYTRTPRTQHHEQPTFHPQAPRPHPGKPRAARRAHQTSSPLERR